MRRHTFRVVGYSSGYAVQHVPTGKEHWMSDGVDVLTTPTGRTMRPGSEYFRQTWERALNHSASETLEAYFPELDE